MRSLRLLTLVLLAGCEGQIFTSEPLVPGPRPIDPTNPNNNPTNPTNPTDPTQPMPDVNPFACDTTEAPDTLDARRLARLEYQNALRDLFARALGTNDTTALLTNANVDSRLPPDPPGGYSTGDTNFGVLHATATFEIADAIATSIGTAPNYTRFVTTFVNYAPGTCTNLTPATLSDACEDALIRNFLLRAWGRPVEEGNANLNDELASFRQEFTLAATSREGVEAMVLKALIAPQFLFHLQIELTPTANPERFNLTSHAIARRLSFNFARTLPNEALLQYAATNDLTTDQGFAGALELASSDLGGTVTQFSREWLHLDALPQFTDATHPKAIRIRQGITANDTLRNDMRDEVLELWRWVNDNGGTLQDVLTNDMSFARSPDLMRIYGQTVPAPASVTTANAIRFAPGERSGLLTRAAMLTSGGHTENPIHRAIHIRQNLLCLSTPQPTNLPPNSLAPPLPNAALTTRQRYHEKTSGQPCAGCHQFINPFGFALSNYNALGAIQLTEPAFDENWTYSGELTTNSSVDLMPALQVARTVNNGVELSEVISTNPNLKACATRNLFTYLNGLQTMPGATASSCGMNRMYQALTDGAPLRDVVRSASTDSRYRQRTLRSSP